MMVIGHKLRKEDFRNQEKQSYNVGQLLNYKQNRACKNLRMVFQQVVHSVERVFKIFTKAVFITMRSLLKCERN